MTEQQQQDRIKVWDPEVSELSCNVIELIKGPARKDRKLRGTWIDWEKSKIFFLQLLNSTSSVMWLLHFISFPLEGNGTPLQYSCLENSMDRRAWWAIVYGVAKTQT